jgi:hypothetical protein
LSVQNTKAVRPVVPAVKPSTGGKPYKKGIESREFEIADCGLFRVTGLIASEILRAFIAPRVMSGQTDMLLCPDKYAIDH